MKTSQVIFSLLLSAGLSTQHAAMMPPSPDKILTPNSSEAPEGCKLLASDVGFPNNETLAAELPQAVAKEPGTKNPDWTVVAESVEDVQASVLFAAKHNVRLTIITTGHDFGGREGARSGLRIDLSGITEPTVFAESWKCGDELVPGADVNTITPVDGQQAVARVSASMYHETFYNQAHESGLFVMGAQHGGVGTIGGWAQAGGHSPFVREYGFQSDQIVEFEVVTADGEFQKVSECNNPDLFWALRGGGGSTFGVVTAATVKVYPTIPVAVGRFFVNSTTPALWDAVAYFFQNGPALREKFGIQGYFYVYQNAFQSVLHMPSEYATEENARAALEPLKEQMDALAGAEPQPIQYYTYPTYKDWYSMENGNETMEENGTKFLAWYDGSDGSTPGQAQAMENPLSLLPWSIEYPQGPTSAKVKRHGGEGAQAMSRTYLDSRLLSEEHVNSISQEELAQVINATFPGIPNNHIRGFLYGGGKQAAIDPDETSLNPAWREASYHVIINAVPGNLRHDYDVSALKKAFPDAGAYLNEASPGSADWKTAYFGRHYETLEQMKKTVDPDNVFWCSPCVGADMFTYDDERLCPNPEYPSGGPAPQTYVNMESTVGIASLPGEPGIDDPLAPYIQDYLENGVIPAEMPDFDMGGHSHGGEEGGEEGHTHGGEEGGEEGHTHGGETGGEETTGGEEGGHSHGDEAGGGHSHGM